MARVEIYRRIAEVADIIAASVPDADLRRLVYLLNYGGGCGDLGSAPPVLPPYNLKVTGSPNIALNKAARIIKQYFPNLKPLLQLLEAHIRDGDGKCHQFLRALYSPLPVDTRPVGHRKPGPKPSPRVEI